MEYKAFGQTGMQVSAIGFGCWEMGGGYGSIEETEVIGAIHRALDLGINCFDTAEAYGMGRSEELLARALGDRRKDVIVVSKFGINYDNDRLKGRDSRRSMAHAAIDRRLKALNTDYVDVYLCIGLTAPPRLMKRWRRWKRLCSRERRDLSVSLISPEMKSRRAWKHGALMLYSMPATCLIGVWQNGSSPTLKRTISVS